MPLIIGNSATGNPVAAVKKLKKNKKGQVVGSTWGDPYQYAGQSNVALSEGKMPGMPSNQEEAALRALSAGYNQIFHHPPDPDTADQLLRSSVGDELQTDSHGWAQLFQGNQAQRFEESQMSPQDWIDSLANTLSWEANPDVHGDHAGFMTAAQPTTVAEPVTPAQHQQAALAAGGRAPGARLVTEYHAPEFGAPGAETAQDLPFSYSVVQQSGQGTYPHLAPKVKDFISLVNLGRPVKIYGKPATSWYSPGDLVTNDKGVVVPRAGAKPVKVTYAARQVVGTVSPINIPRFRKAEVMNGLYTAAEKQAQIKQHFAGAVAIAHNNNPNVKLLSTTSPYLTPSDLSSIDEVYHMAAQVDESLSNPGEHNPAQAGADWILKNVAGQTGTQAIAPDVNIGALHIREGKDQEIMSQTNPGGQALANQNLTIWMAVDDPGTQPLQAAQELVSTFGQNGEDTIPVAWNQPVAGPDGTMGFKTIDLHAEWIKYHSTMTNIHTLSELNQLFPGAAGAGKHILQFAKETGQAAAQLGSWMDNDGRTAGPSRIGMGNRGAFAGHVIGGSKATPLRDAFGAIQWINGLTDHRIWSGESEPGRISVFGDIPGIAKDIAAVPGLAYKGVMYGANAIIGGAFVWGKVEGQEFFRRMESGDYTGALETFGKLAAGPGSAFIGAGLHRAGVKNALTDDLANIFNPAELNPEQELRLRAYNTAMATGQWTLYMNLLNQMQHGAKAQSLEQSKQWGTLVANLGNQKYYQSNFDWQHAAQPIFTELGINPDLHLFAYQLTQAGINTGINIALDKPFTIITGSAAGFASTKVAAWADRAAETMAPIEARISEAQESLARADTIFGEGSEASRMIKYTAEKALAEATHDRELAFSKKFSPLAKYMMKHHPAWHSIRKILADTTDPSAIARAFPRLSLDVPHTEGSAEAIAYHAAMKSAQEAADSKAIAQAIKDGELTAEEGVTTEIKMPKIGSRMPANITDLLAKEMTEEGIDRLVDQYGPEIGGGLHLEHTAFLKNAAIRAANDPKAHPQWTKLFQRLEGGMRLDHNDRRSVFNTLEGRMRALGWEKSKITAELNGYLRSATIEDSRDYANGMLDRMIQYLHNNKASDDPAWSWRWVQKHASEIVAFTSKDADRLGDLHPDQDWHHEAATIDESSPGFDLTSRKIAGLREADVASTGDNFDVERAQARARAERSMQETQRGHPEPVDFNDRDEMTPGTSQERVLHPTETPRPVTVHRYEEGTKVLRQVPKLDKSGVRVPHENTWVGHVGKKDAIKFESDIKTEGQLRGVIAQARSKGYDAIELHYDGRDRHLILNPTRYHAVNAEGAAVRKSDITLADALDRHLITNSEAVKQFGPTKYDQLLDYRAHVDKARMSRGGRAFGPAIRPIGRLYMPQSKGGQLHELSLVVEKGEQQAAARAMYTHEATRALIEEINTRIAMGGEDAVDAARLMRAIETAKSGDKGYQEAITEFRRATEAAQGAAADRIEEVKWRKFTGVSHVTYDPNADTAAFEHGPVNMNHTGIGTDIVVGTEHQLPPNLPQVDRRAPGGEPPEGFEHRGATIEELTARNKELRASMRGLPSHPRNAEGQSILGEILENHDRIQELSGIHVSTHEEQVAQWEKTHGRSINGGLLTERRAAVRATVAPPGPTVAVNLDGAVSIGMDEASARRDTLIQTIEKIKSVVAGKPGKNGEFVGGMDAKFSAEAPAENAAKVSTARASAARHDALAQSGDVALEAFRNRDVPNGYEHVLGATGEGDSPVKYLESKRAAEVMPSYPESWRKDKAASDFVDRLLSWYGKVDEEAAFTKGEGTDWEIGKLKSRFRSDVRKLMRVDKSLSNESAAKKVKAVWLKSGSKSDAGQLATIQRAVMDFKRYEAAHVSGGIRDIYVTPGFARDVWERAVAIEGRDLGTNTSSSFRNVQAGIRHARWSGDGGLQNFLEDNHMIEAVEDPNAERSKAAAMRQLAETYSAPVQWTGEPMNAADAKARIEELDAMVARAKSDIGLAAARSDLLGLEPADVIDTRIVNGKQAFDSGHLYVLNRSRVIATDPVAAEAAEANNLGDRAVARLHAAQAASEGAEDRLSQQLALIRHHIEHDMGFEVGNPEKERAWKELSDMYQAAVLARPATADTAARRALLAFISGDPEGTRAAYVETSDLADKIATLLDPNVRHPQEERDLLFDRLGREMDELGAQMQELYNNPIKSARPFFVHQQSMYSYMDTSNADLFHAFAGPAARRWQYMQIGHAFGIAPSLDEISTLYKSVLLAKLSTMMRIVMGDEMLRLIPEGINPWRSVPDDYKESLMLEMERNPELNTKITTASDVMTADHVAVFPGDPGHFEAMRWFIGNAANDDATTKYIECWDKAVNADDPLEAQKAFRALLDKTEDEGGLAHFMENTGRSYDDNWGPGLYTDAHGVQKAIILSTSADAKDAYAKAMDDVIGGYFSDGANSPAARAIRSGQISSDDYHAIPKQQLPTITYHFSRSPGMHGHWNPMDGMWKMVDEASGALRRACFKTQYIKERRLLDRLGDTGLSEAGKHNLAVRRSLQYVDRVQFSEEKLVGEDMLRNVIFFLPAYRQFAQYWGGLMARHPMYIPIFKRLQSIPTTAKVGGMTFYPKSLTFVTGGGSFGQGGLAGLINNWGPGAAPLLSIPAQFISEQTGWSLNSIPLLGYAGKGNVWNAVLDRAFFALTGDTLPRPFGRPSDVYNTAILREMKAVYAQRVAQGITGDALTKGLALAAKNKVREGALGQAIAKFFIPCSLTLSTDQTDEVYSNLAQYDALIAAGQEGDARALLESQKGGQAAQTMRDVIAYRNLPTDQKAAFLASHMYILGWTVATTNKDLDISSIFNDLWNHTKINPDTYEAQIAAATTNSLKWQQEQQINQVYADKIAKFQAYMKAYQKKYHLNDKAVSKSSDAYKQYWGAFQTSTGPFDGGQGLTVPDGAGGTKVLKYIPPTATKLTAEQLTAAEQMEEWLGPNTVAGAFATYPYIAKAQKARQLNAVATQLGLAVKSPGENTADDWRALGFDVSAGSRLASTSLAVDREWDKFYAATTGRGITYASDKKTYTAIKAATMANIARIELSDPKTAILAKGVAGRLSFLAKDDDSLLGLQTGSATRQLEVMVGEGATTAEYQPISRNFAKSMARVDKYFKAFGKVSPQISFASTAEAQKAWDKWQALNSSPSLWVNKKGQQSPLLAVANQNLSGYENARYREHVRALSWAWVLQWAEGFRTQLGSDYNPRTKHNGYSPDSKPGKLAKKYMAWVVKYATNTSPEFNTQWNALGGIHLITSMIDYKRQ